VSILTPSFVIFELPPYFENISKRVIKSPKLYFTDPGLVAHLVGIETAEQAARVSFSATSFQKILPQLRHALGGVT
jgi:hypothetical protein